MSGKKNRILEIIIIIITIVFIVLTVGWVISETEKQNKIEGSGDEEKKLTSPEEEKKKLKARLKEIEEKIQFIEDRKVEITRHEKKILVGARMMIGLILLLLNVGYLYFYNLPFKLNAQLNVNGAILMVYSFFAFITYGTPSRFINALKTKITYYLKKKHVAIVEELEPLRLERENIINQLKNFGQ